MSSSSFLSYYSATPETVNISAGISLNLLLLYLIKHNSSPYLGNYKYLLALFATFDCYLCALHGLLNPFAIVIKNTMGAALYAPWQSHILTSFYYGCFSLPFSLMCIHFLYRYWSIANPAHLALFTRPAFVAMLCMLALLQGFLWFCCPYSVRKDAEDIAIVDLKAHFYQTHNAAVEDGWVALDHWRNGDLNILSIKVTIATMIIMFLCLSIATSIASLTYLEIRKATSLSRKFIVQQYTLLIAVCAQTFVPVACVYFPYFFIVMCPFLSLPGFNFSLLVSVFPGWDAVVIIMMIRDYRLGLAKIFGMGQEKVVKINHTQFTTSLQQSTNTSQI